MPHSQVTKAYATCAFTQKMRKFATMMDGRHEVILYSGGEVDVPVHDHVEVGDPEKWFPDGFDPVTTPYSWEPTAPYWKEFLDEARWQLYTRVEPGDLILSCVSTGVHAASDVLDRAPCIEWEVGYEGVVSKHAIFESYTWMHYIYGKNGWWARPYDDVVPGFVDANDFELGEDEGYLLYMGRMTHGKGVHVASEIAARADMPIVFAGPGASTPAYEHEIVCEDGTRCEGQYVGPVGYEERKTLMAGASALIVPTLYIEPFGGVSVEALASGVPVVASDWGVFPETITPDVGRRFRTIQEGTSALLSAMEDLPRGQTLRNRALARWGIQAVTPRFERAFARFASLRG